VAVCSAEPDLAALDLVGLVHLEQPDLTAVHCAKVTQWEPHDCCLTVAVDQVSVDVAGLDSVPECLRMLSSRFLPDCPLARRPLFRVPARA
jgi:hypothetical protein